MEEELLLVGQHLPSCVADAIGGRVRAANGIATSTLRFMDADAPPAAHHRRARLLCRGDGGGVRHSRPLLAKPIAARCALLAAQVFRESRRRGASLLPTQRMQAVLIPRVARCDERLPPERRLRRR